jgi:hypothetical protein
MTPHPERQEIRRAKYLARTGRRDELLAHIRQCQDAAYRTGDQALFIWSRQQVTAMERKERYVS